MYLKGSQTNKAGNAYLKQTSQTAVVFYAEDLDINTASNTAHWLCASNTATGCATCAVMEIQSTNVSTMHSEMTRVNSSLHVDRTWANSSHPHKFLQLL